MVTVNEQMLKQLQLINKQLGENQKSLRKQHATLKETKKLTENAEGAAVDFKDGLSNLKSEIVNVTNVTKNMNKSIVETLSQSKMWTAASRLLSGTGLWSVQNAIRGVIDVLNIYQQSQKEGMERTNKASKGLENYLETSEKFAKTQKKINAIMSKFYDVNSAGNKILKDTRQLRKRGGADKELQQASLQYKLLRMRGVSEKYALKIMKEQLATMDEMLGRQKKMIFGGKIRQKLADKQAQAGLWMLKQGRKMRNKLFGEPALPKSEWKRDERGRFLPGQRRRSERAQFVHDFNKKQLPFQKRIQKHRDNQDANSPWRKGARKFMGNMSGTIKDKWDESPEWNMENLKAGAGNLKEKMKGSKTGQFLSKNKTKIAWALRVVTGIPLMWKFWKMRDKIRGKLQKVWKTVLPNMAFVMGKLKMAMMYFVMVLIGMFLVIRVVKMMWEAMKDWGSFLTEIGMKGMEIGYRLGELWAKFKDWAGALWTLIQAVFTGDMSTFIDAFMAWAWESLLLVWELAKTAASLALTLAIGLFFGFINWVKKPGHLKKLLKGISTVLAIWAVWTLAKWVVAAVTSYIIGLMSATAILWVIGIGLLVLFVVAFRKEIWEGIKKIGAWFKELPARIGKFLKDIIPGIATGGTIQSGGVAVVGERGPELVTLPRGATVYSHAESKKLGNQKNQSGIPNNTNITVNVNGRLGASDRELRDIAKKVGSLINREINRTTSSSGGI